MRATTIRRASVALGGVVALVAAGCGVQSGQQVSTGPAAVTPKSFSGAQAAGVLSRSAASTAKVTTESVSMTMSISLPSGEHVTTTMDGSYDNVHHLGQVETDLGSMFRSLGASCGCSSLPSGKDAKMTEVIDGSTVYLKAPSLSSVLGSASKPWLKMDLHGLATLQGSAAGMNGGQPGAFLDYLQAVGGPVTTVGREQVRGVETTHVKGTIDFAKAVAKATGARRALLQRALKQLGSTGAELRAFPVEVWIDDHGFVRKYSMVIALGSGSHRIDESVEMELFDFGKPVSITVPPSSQVSSSTLPFGSPGHHH